MVSIDPTVHEHEVSIQEAANSKEDSEQNDAEILHRCAPRRLRIRVDISRVLDIRVSLLRRCGWIDIYCSFPQSCTLSVGVHVSDSCHTITAGMSGSSSTGAAQNMTCT